MSVDLIAERLSLVTEQMAALPAIAWPDRPVVAALRVGALATVGRGLDLAQAAEAAGLPMPTVALGFALRGTGGALDHGAVHAMRMAVGYLLSPAAPTRTTGEALLGHAPGSGGPEVATLTWTLLSQLAALPARRPLPIDELVALVGANAARLVTTEPGPDAALTARRYLGILCSMLDAAGLAWLSPELGLTLDGDALADALAWIASAAAEPAPAEPGGAQIEPDGDVLVVRAGDAVPLAGLVPLARLATPRLRDGVVELRLEPSHLEAGPEMVMAAVQRLIGR